MLNHQQTPLASRLRTFSETRIQEISQILGLHLTICGHCGRIFDASVSEQDKSGNQLCPNCGNGGHRRNGSSASSPQSANPQVDSKTRRHQKIAGTNLEHAEQRELRKRKGGKKGPFFPETAQPPVRLSFGVPPPGIGSPTGRKVGSLFALELAGRSLCAVPFGDRIVGADASAAKATNRIRADIRTFILRLMLLLTSLRIR